MVRNCAVQVSALLACAALLAPGASRAGEASSGGGATHGAAPGEWTLVQQYCTQCHNTDDWAGGVAFDTMSAQQIPSDAKVWENAILKLRGGFMPPPNAKKHPDGRAVQGLVSWLENTLDSAATTPVPGRVPLRRINRRQYANAVRDLLGIDVDAAALLPQDNYPKDGFDTNAMSLSVSPDFLDQYVNAARVVAAKAVGNPKAPNVTTTFGSIADMKISLQVRGHLGEGDQQLYRDGMPFGTRGGMSEEYIFPADGDYELTIGDLALGRDVPLMEFRNRVVALLDGKEFFRTDIGGERDQKAIDQRQQVGVDAINDRLRNIRFHATEGPHRIAVTFIHRDFAESDERVRVTALEGGQERVQLMHAFQIRGPLDVTGLSDSTSRKKIFLCHPTSAEEETPCARRIIENLAQLAFRRPVTEQDLHPLMAFYEAGRKSGGFEAGIRDALSAILASPFFLYRVETTAPQVRTGTLPEGTLSDLSLASRLSFFLWSSIPDEELLSVAERNELSHPDVLKREVLRMLADPRSKSLVDDFAFQWLNVDPGLDEIVPDRIEFPWATGALDPRPLFKRELSLFIDSVLRSNQPVTALLTADYTYLNESLAMLYGIENVKGGEFRRVKLTDSKRFGLLGKGAVLMLSANPDRTSPVRRGAWIIQRILGSPAPTPPPNVPTLATNIRGKPARTLRERVMQHSVQPNCHACHGVMDPLGFALENFNAVGQYRTIDPETNTPIDSRGVLPDGTVINGPDDLRRALAAQPDAFVQSFTAALMSYALGRPLDYHDMPVVRDIVHEAAHDDYRFSSIVVQIVSSAEFRRRAPPPQAPRPAVKTASLVVPALKSEGD
jgi:mono/diheme cytochrome c family protein